MRVFLKTSFLRFISENTIDDTMNSLEFKFTGVTVEPDNDIYFQMLNRLAYNYSIQTDDQWFFPTLNYTIPINDAQ